MGVERLDNAAPVVYSIKSRAPRNVSKLEDASVEDPIDVEEVFDYIRDINDPEHPYTLEQLNVVQEELIKVCDKDDADVGRERYVDVSFTPTIPHCSMATLIGLAIYVKLKRSLDPEFKVLQFLRQCSCTLSSTKRTVLSVLLGAFDCLGVNTSHCINKIVVVMNCLMSDVCVQVMVHITPGSHATEEAINRQLADKERVAAAMENANLMQTINQCLKPRE